MKKKIFLMIGTLLLLSCKKEVFRESIIVAGGEVISANTLRQGQDIYQEYCMACHGEKGDGKGVASKGMKTPPRDFTTGLIKFGDTLSGELPHDQAIYQTLRQGLAGTAMLPWDLSPQQMRAVWQYIKTFAPKIWIGKDKELGKKVTLSKDPYSLARKQSAIAKGKEVYHISASCQTCHPGHVAKEELNAMSLKIDGEGIDELEENFYYSKLQESEHGASTMPPDFTWDLVRSGDSISALAYRIAAGIGGTTMPAWKDTITDDEIWAVAYYVRHLIEMQGQVKIKLKQK